MGSVAPALLLLFAAPFLIVLAIFLVATRKSDSTFPKVLRISLLIIVAWFFVISSATAAIDEFRRPPTRHVLYIHHEFASIEGCEPGGTEDEPTTLVTASFPTNAGYDHPVPLFKDENHFEKMKLVQFGARVITEDGQRNKAEDLFPLPLVGDWPAPDEVFRASVEVPGHGTCEIDHMIAREVEVDRPD